MQNVFSTQDVNDIISRINHLTPDTKPLWGKMSATQMLAHCNVSYEMAFENKHPKPNAFMRFILKHFVKDKVTSEKPYGQNAPTAPQFIIKDERSFDLERSRLIAYINKTKDLGEKYFEGKESLSFGKLTSKEWNNMLAKHLHHHLSQFGV
ncbi:MAG: hypothetical protein RIR48_3135 [Bacteroidota bacterium]|jgi:hypothetical protein